jgi:cell wall-associated NlpC family hydrolase
MLRSVAPLSAEESAAFIAAARGLIGTPFKHRGRSDAGTDCIGLVKLALQGRDTADERLYGRQPEPEGLRLRATLREHFGDPVPLAAGCVVLMRWHALPNHVAIVADYIHGGLSLIHADARVGRVVETRLSDPWPRRIIEAYRP